LLLPEGLHRGTALPKVRSAGPDLCFKGTALQQPLALPHDLRPVGVHGCGFLESPAIAKFDAAPNAPRCKPGFDNPKQ